MQTPTLARLADPDLTRLMYEGVINDTQRLLTSGSPAEAIVAGIAGMYEERLARQVHGLDWPPARLPPDATPGEAAGLIGGILAWHDGPATPVFARLAQAPVTVRVTCAAHRELEADEAGPLKAAPGVPVYGRTGEMTAGGVLVARTWLLLVRGRIPLDALEAIQEGQSAGEALEPYGMRRGRRRVRLSRADATIHASALLFLGAMPAGMAEERVTRQFCEHVALLA